MKSRHVHSQSLSPLGKAKRLPFMLDHSVVAAIPHLFRVRGPADIARFVVAVIIDPVNTVLWRWAWTYVLIEGRKLEPCITNLDPSTAVIGPPYSVRVGTPVQHACPNFVVRVILHGVSIDGSITCVIRPIAQFQSP